MIEIEGEIERVTYTSEESGFTVVRFRPNGGGEPITLTGTFVEPRPGTLLHVSGEWVDHPRFGRQLKISEYRPVVPATREGIERYLSSGLLRGVGPVTAKRIVARFGEETLTVLDREPARLREITGIGRKRADEIRAAWAEQRGVRDVMLFLQSNGVSTAHAARIFRQYGPRAIELVRSNPYRLAEEVFGIGFTTADAIAGRLGIAPDSPERCDAGVLRAVAQMTDEGNTVALCGEVIRRGAELLAVDPVLAQSALERLVASEKLVRTELPAAPESLHPTPAATGADEPMIAVVALPALEAAEARIAARLRALSVQKSTRSAATIALASRRIDETQARLGITLAPEQREAVVSALLDPIVVLTGGPGTGKTTLLRVTLDILSAGSVRLLLAAPTGRAAKRMAEATGREAATIHRLLAYDPRTASFRHDASHPLPCDLLVVDEASMIDTPLMASLLEAIASPTRLLLVGDADQLPSVGPGSVLRDLIASRTLPVVALARVFRQSEKSRIVVAAHGIIRGVVPEFTGREEGDLFFIEQVDPDRIVSLIVTLVTQRIPKRFGFDPFDDIQVITPMNRGSLGTIALNEALQAALNGAHHADRPVAGRLRIGDKVMQTRNDYDKEVFNGDMGRVVGVDREAQSVTVSFDAQRVDYGFQELDELQLAYAVSVHKSQGSEYPAVVIPLVTQHFVMLQRNLLYTAVTRGKRLVVLVGTKRALSIAVKNDRTQARMTGLRARLLREGGAA